MIDLLATPESSSQASSGADRPGRLAKFENLMVLHIMAGSDENKADKPGALPIGLTLAVPAARRDEFATATAGAHLLVTRQIVVVK